MSTYESVMKYITNVSIFITWFSCGVFICLNLTRTWRRTYAGRALMYRTISLFAVFTLICLGILTDNDYFGRTVIRTIAYVSMAVSTVYLSYVAMRNPDEGLSMPHDFERSTYVRGTEDESDS